MPAELAGHGPGRRASPSRSRVNPWQIIAGALGVGIVGWAAHGLRDPLASMASYTAALMALNQVAPPLLLLALPQRVGMSWPSTGVLLDPWLATITFVGLSVAVSLPGVLDPTLSNALYAAPLGLLELLSGLVFWAQFMQPTRRIRRSWLAGTLAWVGAIPMTVVALVWMLAQDVLYTPYLDVICRWDVPPLLDQKWAGFVMFVAGVPLQLMGVWLLLAFDRPAT